MNVENIRKMITTIREHEKQFSMRQFVVCENVRKFVTPDGEDPLYSETLDERSSPLNNCGTICCLAGFANALDAIDNMAVKGSDDSWKFINYGDCDNACTYMGIDRLNAYSLFYPGPQSRIWGQAMLLGIISLKDGYEATAEDAIAVLEAIIDGRIKLKTDL